VNAPRSEASHDAYPGVFLIGDERQLDGYDRYLQATKFGARVV
jgi:hypothetical protein